MIRSYAFMFDKEISRLYRLEALAKKYKDALEWQCGGDVEWQDRLTAAQEALFKELSVG